MFLTQTCQRRRPALLGIESLVLEVLDELRRAEGWRVHAHVIGPDHLHLIVGGEGAVGDLMRAFKLRLTRRAGLGRVWQERFFDHVIRDNADLHRHLDYVHFNPVKHGWSVVPEAYRWSSFRSYRERGFYLPDWGHVLPPGLDGLDLD